MVIKSLMAAAAIAGAVAFGSAGAANADPHVTLGIGFDVGAPEYVGWDGGYDGGYNAGYDGENDWRRRHHRDRWDDRRPDMPYRISCAEGRNIVARAGFRGVAAFDCSFPVYRYVAWKRGQQFRVGVNFRGDIVNVRPTY